MKGSINHLAMHDFEIFKELYDYDLAVFDKAFGTDCYAIFSAIMMNTGCNSKVYNQRICDRICDTSKRLAEASSCGRIYGRYECSFIRISALESWAFTRHSALHHDEDGVQ